MAWRIVVEDWVASAIGSFFVALGEAIVAWGMALVGTYQAALGQIQSMVQQAGEVLGELLAWIWDFIVSVAQLAIDSVVTAMTAYVQSVEGALSLFLLRLLDFQQIGSGETLEAALAAAVAFALSFLGLQSFAQPITEMLLTVQRFVQPLASVFSNFQMAQALAGGVGSSITSSAAGVFGSVQNGITQGMAWLLNLDIGPGGVLDTLGVYSVAPVDTSSYSSFKIDTFVLFAQAVGIYGGLTKMLLDASVSALEGISLAGWIFFGILVSLGVSGTGVGLYSKGAPVAVLGKLTLVAGSIGLVLTIISRLAGNMLLSLFSMLISHFNSIVGMVTNVEIPILVLVSILEFFLAPIAFAVG